MLRTFWHTSKDKKDEIKDYDVTYKELRHFDRNDFACPCCGENKMPLWFMQEIDDCRHQTGFPWIVTSACRCEKHNKNIEGSKTSSHLTTNIEVVAVDIFVGDSAKRWEIEEQLKLHGFKRIGHGYNFIHADKDLNKPQGVSWVY